MNYKEIPEAKVVDFASNEVKNIVHKGFEFKYSSDELLNGDYDFKIYKGNKLLGVFENLEINKAYGGDIKLVVIFENRCGCLGRF